MLGEVGIFVSVFQDRAKQPRRPAQLRSLRLVFNFFNYFSRTICYSTHVIPFRVEFRTGLSIYEQVTYAAKRAIIAGQLRPGEPFPSVRLLSKELKINPNTAHKVVAALVSAHLLETQPGIGTVVAHLPESTRAERAQLLGPSIEQLVVEAKKLSIEKQDILDSIGSHWERLSFRANTRLVEEKGGRGKK